MKRRLLPLVAFAVPMLAPGLVPGQAWGQAPVIDRSTSVPASSGAASPSRTTRTSSPGVRTAPAESDTVALRRQLADLTLEIEQLRTEVRELRGQVETQTHELDSLKNRNREALADMDKRLREQERRSAPVAPGASVPVPEAGRAAAPPPTAGEQQEYDAAFGLMKQGYYERAGKSFRDFIVKYPSSELAGHAQYWAGEAQYVVRNFKAALEEFSRVLEKYPSSPKLADALLKIGYCHHELGDLVKARETLQQLINRYPNTANAKSAERRLADIRAAEARQKTADTKPKVPGQR
jgi:tol-pal system protein YbgF